MIPPISLSPRDARVLRVGLLAIGAIVLGGKVWPAVRAWEGRQVTLAAEIGAQLAAAEGHATSIAYVRDSAAARTRRLESQWSQLVSGLTSDAAAASLGALLEELARHEGADVLTMTLKPDSVVRQDFARVTARFGAECDVEGLMNLLAAIESHERPMIVRELSVVQPDPAAPPSRVETLRFDVTVETLARVARSSDMPTRRSR